MTQSSLICYVLCFFFLKIIFTKRSWIIGKLQLPLWTKCAKYMTCVLEVRPGSNWALFSNQSLCLDSKWKFIHKLSKFSFIHNYIFVVYIFNWSIYRHPHSPSFLCQEHVCTNFHFLGLLTGKIFFFFFLLSIAKNTNVYSLFKHH